MIRTILYNFGLFLFSVYCLPLLFWKGKFHKDIIQRFALYGKESLPLPSAGIKTIWIQAVSVGEVGLCKIFLPHLLEAYPDHRIVISTITRAGYDFARKSLAGRDVSIIYFPIDFSFVVKNAIRKIDPSLFIMVETEIWPNLLWQLKAKKVPAVMINGRISDKSIGSYRLVKPFLKTVLEGVGLFCMRSDVDALRIEELGANPERVKVTGNIKYDLSLPLKNIPNNNLAKRLGLAEDSLLFVAGSTHEGEDEIIMSVYKSLRKSFSSLRLVIAPRHIERKDKIALAAGALGLDVIFYSQTEIKKVQDDDVVILDTIGQLNDVYAHSTVVFIGGSLIKHGGHNPIEPAVFRKTILFGPYMHNFSDISDAFIAQGAAVKVSGTKDMIDACTDLLSDNKKRDEMGERARVLVEKMKGASERIIGHIKELYK